VLVTTTSGDTCANYADYTSGLPTPPPPPSSSPPTAPPPSSPPTPPPTATTSPPPIPSKSVTKYYIKETSTSLIKTTFNKTMQINELEIFNPLTQFSLSKDSVVFYVGINKNPISLFCLVKQNNLECKAMIAGFYSLTV
jgi:hypothetical protein